MRHTVICYSVALINFVLALTSLYFNQPRVAACQVFLALAWVVWGNL